MESTRKQYVRTRAEAYRLRAEVGRLQAEIASKNRLLPSLLAEGAATERARAERAEALVAEMLDALRAAQHALRVISKTVRDNDPELALIHAAIAKATGAKP